ncbi:MULTISPECIES: hypothetical protein [Pelosinus]|jgi:hypothetical protein|uniref:Uncharacterized protein n=1 Tax=Pelosinus fermentans B4 TaxID=1149862 RepID=I8RFH7_9FIRM|nr:MULTISPECIES: hypothetical protein [Pelosinus]MDF2570422.1 hypothetical protein [Sporomusa sp.]EIW16425.1 hypothetical protein FB4_0936 [Pelosinus fermentans B4]EIW22594.1 hypothetical protein FA11_0177 [Pelosinus fermentans A11]OAM95732.1 hypothetical protein FR7_03753 [Pelosinus fermentans DSM 17108]SDR32155.1 hypothetical protein SAMN04515679_3896 [Pelosinus fermentans]
MVKILVACGSGIAMSTVAQEAIKIGGAYCGDIAADCARHSQHGCCRHVTNYDMYFRCRFPNGIWCFRV